MAFLEFKERKLELNEEGFLVNFQDWNEELAICLAKQEEGLENLSDEHWLVIRYIREFFLEKNMAPMVRSICKVTGLPLRRIYEIFPSGPAKGACKLAGLPKPDGCV